MLDGYDGQLSRSKLWTTVLCLVDWSGLAWINEDASGSMHLCGHRHVDDDKQIKGSVSLGAR